MIIIYYTYHRKPKLPIEMVMAMKQQDGAELSEKEQDVVENGWDPDEIAKHMHL